MNATDTYARMADLPPVGALMTVQIRDQDGTTHTFHGTRGGIHTVATTPMTRRDTRQVRYLRVIGAADEPMVGEDPATLSQYVTVHSATGAPFRRGTLAHSGPEHFFSAGEHSLSVPLFDAETATYAAAAPEGEQWVQAHLSLDRRKEGFLDRLRAMDSAMASEAATLFDLAEQQARHRGFTEGHDSAGGF